MGPQLSVLPAVLSHGQGRGEDQPHRLLSHCESHMESTERSEKSHLAIVSSFTVKETYVRSQKLSEKKSLHYSSGAM